MKATIIIIGDELLNARVSDINGPFLASWLNKKGIELEAIHIIKDREADLLDCLQKSWSKSDLVLTSGGLGPTVDDRTKSILGQFFRAGLVESDQARELAIQQYQRIEKSWNPKDNSYHMIPKGFDVLSNPKGLAPGLCFHQGHGKKVKLLLAAPGVPRELQAMALEVWNEPLKKHFPLLKNELQQITIRTRHITEEKIFGKMYTDLWATLEAYGKVSSLPQSMGVDLVISFSGNEQQKKMKIKELKKIFRAGPLEEYIWQWGELSLPELIISEAKEKKITIALAESCTGGLSSNRLTDIAGSSRCFLGSVVTYSNESKMALLGVRTETLKSFGAVSEQTAKEMAEGVVKVFNADLSLSFTGIAGPSGGSIKKPVGTVAIGISSKSSSSSKLYHFRGDRKRLKIRFSEQGLFSLLMEIRQFVK